MLWATRRSSADGAPPSGVGVGRARVRGSRAPLGRGGRRGHPGRTVRAHGGAQAQGDAVAAQATKPVQARASTTIMTGCSARSRAGASPRASATSVFPACGDDAHAHQSVRAGPAPAITGAVLRGARVGTRRPLNWRRRSRAASALLAACLPPAGSQGPRRAFRAVRAGALPLPPTAVVRVSPSTSARRCRAAELRTVDVPRPWTRDPWLPRVPRRVGRAETSGAWRTPTMLSEWSAEAAIGGPLGDGGVRSRRRLAAPRRPRTPRRSAAEAARPVDATRVAPRRRAPSVKIPAPAGPRRADRRHARGERRWQDHSFCPRRAARRARPPRPGWRRPTARAPRARPARRA